MSEVLTTHAGNSRRFFLEKWNEWKHLTEVGSKRFAVLTLLFREVE